MTEYTRLIYNKEVLHAGADSDDKMYNIYWTRVFGCGGGIMMERWWYVWIK